ncbi:hypothetical protein M408DRAFT_13484, partial [Serendipita vermifera MAFF 305830]
MATFLLLVGSYTSYITSLRFAPASSSLTYITQTACGGSPSWLAQHPSNSSIICQQNSLDATQEVWNAPGMIYSLVSHPSTGSLTPIASISTGTPNGAAGSVYVQAINNGESLAAANYNAGSAFIVPLGTDKTSFSGSGQ